MANTKIYIGALINIVLLCFSPSCFSADTDISIRTPQSFMEWNGWKIPVNKFGNPGIRYLSEKEWDNFLALEKLALSSKKEPVIYKVIYCLSTSTEMTRLKPDGSIEIQRAEMTPAQIDFCRKSFEQLKRMVFAYSGGNVKIESVESNLDIPFRGEYSDWTGFYPSDYMDIGEGLNIEEFDGIIAHYYPGPVRIKSPFQSIFPTPSSLAWCKNVLACSIIYDPAIETGGEISILAKRTLRGWCNTFYFYFYRMEEGSPYYGQGTPGAFALQESVKEPELYFLQYISALNLWRNTKLASSIEKFPESQNKETGESENKEDETEFKKYFTYDEIKDDIFRKLPPLYDDELEKRTGCKIIAACNNNLCFFDVSKAQGISSVVLHIPDENDCSLNNEINFAKESMAFIRFSSEDGEQHDLLFVRIDMLEPILDLLRVQSDKPDLAPRNRILGYIDRVIVIDTFLGDLPPNELGMLKALDSHISLDAKTSKNRIIKGEKGSIAFTSTNIGSGIIDTGILKLSGFPDDKIAKVGSIYNLGESESHNLSIDISTENLKSGPLVLSATLDYEIGEQKFSICKPVAFDIRDAVEAEIIPEHTNLISKSEFNLLVTLRNNTGGRERGSVELELPDKWKARPSSYDFDIRGLDETHEFKFAITIKDENPDGDYSVGAFLKIKDRKTKGPVAVCHIRKSFGSNLLKYSFDKSIEGDFAVTDGLFKVSLSRETPFAGSACLKVEDEGGSHYGHVGMFSQEIFRPDRENTETAYAFDTEDYPLLDFYLRYDSPDVNLGISVTLDDNNHGYGIVLNGEWDTLISKCPVVAKVQAPADNKWQRVTIDLDKALDDYLGNIPHRIAKIKIGDTREMDFGWWKDTDKRTFYIDEFSIRKR